MPTPTDRAARSARLDLDDDGLLKWLGYRPSFARTLNEDASFAVGFSFISVTTGIFTTFGFLLATAGPRGIWTWPIAVTGQLLVALVYGALAARLPVAGYSYQWASRLLNPKVGWWLGWLSLCFLVVVTCSVDYALAQTAIQPLLGLNATPTTTAAWTLGVICSQAVLIGWSTRATTKLNNTAVLTELIGLGVLAIGLLTIGMAFDELGDWRNLTSTGTVPAEGWWSWLGPGMLASLLGAYTIVGFEACANLAEETHHPRQTIPTAMVKAVVASGTLGMLLLVGLVVTIRDPAQVTASPSPVALLLDDIFGGAIELFLSFIVLAIYACGTVIMATGSRLAWAMARDRRLPGHSRLARVPKASGGPTWATGTVATVSALIVVSLSGNPDALVTLFTAATLLPALLYTATVLLYARTVRRDPGPRAVFRLGRWRRPVVAGALAWLALELVVLLAPSQFRPAQRYVMAALGVGLLVYGWLWATDPTALTTQPTPPPPRRGEQSLWTTEQEAARS